MHTGLQGIAIILYIIGITSIATLSFTIQLRIIGSNRTIVIIISTTIILVIVCITIFITIAKSTIVFIITITNNTIVFIIIIKVIIIVTIVAILAITIAMLMLSKSYCSFYLFFGSRVTNLSKAFSSQVKQRVKLLASDCDIFRLSDKGLYPAARDPTDGKLDSILYERPSLLCECETDIF